MGRGALTGPATGGEGKSTAASAAISQLVTQRLGLDRDAAVIRYQRLLIGAILVSELMGMAGGTWDAAWHVTFLRETFWTPPHLLLYAGTVGSLLAGWAGVGLAGISGRRAPGFGVVAAGALVVVGAAPLDEFWHRTFGRDVDVWSFPHLVAVTGGATIAVGALMAVETDQRRAGGGRLGHQIAKIIVLASLLWVAMFAMNWYTLVLAAVRDSVKYPILACLVASPALVLSALVLGRGGATVVSAVYMAYVASAHGLLAGLGYAALPFPPLLVVPAIAVDAIFWSARETTWRRALVAGMLIAPAFYLGEAASLAWYPHGTFSQPPVAGPALGYYLERLDRPWDLPHVAIGLGPAMAMAIVGSLVGLALSRFRREA